MKFCKSKENKLALTVGLFMASIHAIWALMVAIIPNALQGFLDWIFNVHFIVPVWNLTAFNLVNALMLVLVTFIIGYLAALLFVWLLKVTKMKK
jgi:hypothetical protein